MDNNLNQSSAAFNISLGSLERINIILTGCSMNTFKRDFLGLCHSLLTLRKETNVFFNTEEKKLNDGYIDSTGKQITGYEKQLDEYVYWLEDSLQNKTLDLKYLTQKNKEKMRQLEKFLEVYEKFLRSVLHRKGLLLKMEKDASKAAIDL